MLMLHLDTCCLAREGSWVFHRTRVQSGRKVCKDSKLSSDWLISVSVQESYWLITPNQTEMKSSNNKLN